MPRPYRNFIWETSILVPLWLHFFFFCCTGQAVSNVKAKIFPADLEDESPTLISCLENFGEPIVPITFVLFK